MREDVVINLPTKHGQLAVRVSALACPNPDCKELVLSAFLGKVRYNAVSKPEIHTVLRHWKLLPDSSVQPMPDYVPEAIVADYREACLIQTLSPKASATLSRRCLQGMIRDFWGITRSRLKDEIDALQNTLDAETWTSIDAVRKIGNIGAHMEKDINQILDVEPTEAKLLIELIETLVAEWYVARHDRQERMKKLADAALNKDAAKKNPPAGTP